MSRYPPRIFDIIARAQAIISRSLGEALAVTQQQAGITQRHIRNLHNEAQEQVWEPLTFQGAKGPLGKEKKDHQNGGGGGAVVDAVIKDRYGRRRHLPSLPCEQWRIQHWIERIPYHIQEVFRLDGGNEYNEGHPAVKEDKDGQ